MSAMSFILKAEPPQRLDLSPLLPHLLARRNEKQIASIQIGTTTETLRVGDLFRIRMGDAETVRFTRGSSRLDFLAHAMQGGRILVDGDVGICAGRLMQDGQLSVKGDAGHWAASGLKSGRVEIAGSCGDFLGGPRPGEMAGMRGGIVRIGGHAGQRAGDRLRRGIILIDGKAGPYAGSRMIAGTLIVSRDAGPLPGYLMRRGTIIIGRGAEAYSPTFIENRVGRPTILELMRRDLADLGLRSAALNKRDYTRLGGDTAVLGKGEIFAG